MRVTLPILNGLVRATKNLNGYLLQIGQRWRQEDELVKLLRRPAPIL